MFTEKEFAVSIRNKFGTNDNLPDSFIVTIFIDKYQIYSRKIKTTKKKRLDVVAVDIKNTDILLAIFIK